MRKKMRTSGRPKMQCGICKFVVDTKMHEGEIVMVNHHPDSGDTIPESDVGCIGSKFPRMAKLVIGLKTEG